MDIKKITRNPLFYVLMIGFLLVRSVGEAINQVLGGEAARSNGRTGETTGGRAGERASGRADDDLE